MPKLCTLNHGTFYVLLARDRDGKQVASVPSPRDLEGTRRLAQGVMRLLPEAAFTDVYTFAKDLDLAKAQPIETIHRDAAGGDAREEEE